MAATLNKARIANAVVLDHSERESDGLEEAAKNWKACPPIYCSTLHSKLGLGLAGGRAGGGIERAGLNKLG